MLSNSKPNKRQVNVFIHELMKTVVLSLIYVSLLNSF